MIGRAEKKLGRRIQWWFELHKLKQYEQESLRQFNTVISMSKPDRDLIRRLIPSANVVIVPNGVDSEFFRPPVYNRAQPNSILFFGNLGYIPNQDALAYFINEIWPIILNQNPAVILEIVGPFATEEVKRLTLRQPNVLFIGYVEDIRPHLWKNTACVVPLRMGGGTRLKILEALAAGCPVISTSIGAEGLDLEIGRDLIVADQPKDFASQTTRLLADNALQQSFSRCGQLAVAAKYDWLSIAAMQTNIYQDLAQKAG